MQEVNRLQKTQATLPLEDICASFQKAVIDTLLKKFLNAASHFNVRTLVVSGGVAANGELRKRLIEESQKRNLILHVPPSRLCTDNAAMIAVAAYFQWQAGHGVCPSFHVSPRLSVTESPIMERQSS